MQEHRARRKEIGGILTARIGKHLYAGVRMFADDNNRRVPENLEALFPGYISGSLDDFLPREMDADSPRRFEWLYFPQPNINAADRNDIIFASSNVLRHQVRAQQVSRRHILRRIWLLYRRSRLPTPDRRAACKDFLPRQSCQMSPPHMPGEPTPAARADASVIDCLRHRTITPRHDRRTSKTPSKMESIPVDGSARSRIRIGWSLTGLPAIRKLDMRQ